MSIEENIKFLEDNFPYKTANISSGLELLYDALDEISDEAKERINYLTQNDKYDEAKNHIEKLKELQKYKDKIQQLLGFFADEETTVKNKEEIDYSQSNVDNKKPHNLNEDFTNKRPYAFVLDQKCKRVSTWKKMMTETAKILIAKDEDLFLDFIDDYDLKGTERKYISFSKNEMWKPRKFKVKDKSIFIESQFSANKIRNIIKIMLRKYDIDINKYKVYLKSDHSKLRK